MRPRRSCECIMVWPSEQLLWHWFMTDLRVQTHVAGSVWGGGGLSGYIHRWRATDNALEGVALVHYDTLLTLDESAEVDSSAAGKAA